MVPKCVNDACFAKDQLADIAANQPNTAFKQSYLAARGFSSDGLRTGGIISPVEVELASDAVLIRLFGGSAKWDGQWWFTPFEMTLATQSFGHGDFGEGRGRGKGILHASLAVLAEEWNSTLEHFCIVELKAPFRAFYGEGDHAVIGSNGGRKTGLILDQRTRAQRTTRQLFLPKFWEHTKHVSVLLSNGLTDSYFLPSLKRYRRGLMKFEA